MTAVRVATDTHRRYQDDPLYEIEWSVDGKTTRVTLTTDLDLCIQQEHDDGPLRHQTIYLPVGWERAMSNAIVFAAGLATGLHALRAPVTRKDIPQ